MASVMVDPLPGEEKMAVTTKYPRMMNPSESGHEDDCYLEAKYDIDFKGEEESESFPRAPKWLVAEDVEARASKFESAFFPLADLSTEDVVAGCAVKGADLVRQSRDHFGQFRSHVRGGGHFDAKKVCELPMAATKACLGGGFYSVALTAKFAPRALRMAQRKCSQWHVYEKAEHLTEALKQKGKQSIQITKKTVKHSWQWLKTKVATFYGLQEDVLPLVNNAPDARV